jgi:hypothetical protein
MFLRTYGGNKAILTPSPRQIKYYAPAFIVYDLNKKFNVAEMGLFVKDKKIDLISIDKWSPHQPNWCKNYAWAAHGYKLIYNSKDVAIFKARR